MPILELVCGDCGIFFELGTKKKIDVSNLLCVDCASPNIKLIASNEEVSTRLDAVVGAMNELIDRVESIERCINEDFGPDEKKQIN